MPVSVLTAEDLASVITNLTANSFDDMTGAGEVSLATGCTFISSEGANELTLAAGAPFQRKGVIMFNHTGTATLKPASPIGYSSIDFTAAGQSVVLHWFEKYGWIILGQNGVTINP